MIGGGTVIGLMALAALIMAGMWSGTSNANARQFCTNTTITSWDNPPAEDPGKIALVNIERFDNRVHVYIRYLFWQETDYDPMVPTGWIFDDNPFPELGLIGIDVDCIPPIRHVACGPHSHPYVQCPVFVEDDPGNQDYIPAGTSVQYWNIGQFLTNTYGTVKDQLEIFLGIDEGVGSSTMFYRTEEGVNNTYVASPATTMTNNILIDSDANRFEPYFWDVQFTYHAAKGHLHWTPPSKCFVSSEVSAALCSEPRDTVIIIG